MALYNLISRDQAFGQANNNYSGDDPSLRLYNLLNGKKADAQYSTDDNFFSKKARSLENAFGTTGAALVSAVDSANENRANEQRQKQAKQSLDDIVKKYGYNSKDEYWDASNAAEKEIFNKYGFDSDAYWDQHAKIFTPANADSQEVKDLEATRQDVINRMSQEDADKIKKFDSIASELQGQTKKNADIADKAAKDWKNYRENSYVGQKVNQDTGKFLGSSINTLSTMSDVLLPGAGVAFNAAQGGIEGIADELEQSGFKNFDWERAKQNAIIGATTGAVTGGLNKGISNVMAKNGGNLFKGGNALTRGLNNLGSKTAVGRVGSTLATGAARGAVSGAVGGATGAGLSAAMNGQDVLQSALQGAAKGAQQGATTGAIMSGANMALSKTPGVGNVMRQLNEAGEDWNNRKARGENFNQRLTGTLNSGDSAVGNWLNRKTQSNLLASAGSVGNRIQDNANVGNVDPWDRLAQQSGYNNYDEVIQRYMEANPNTPLNPNGAAGQILTWLDQNPNTPTTAKGWLKRAGERVLEDANNRGVGMSIKDVSGDEGANNLLLDKNGNKKPMYHGSPNKFETFDPEMIGSNSGNKGLLGEGFYFTDDEGLANDYAFGKRVAPNNGDGMVYEADLDVKNPFYWNSIKSEAEMNNLAKRLGIDDGVLRWNKNNNGGEMHMLDREGEPEIFANALKANGYDGVVYQHNNAGEPGATEVAVFGPEQISRADQDTPTTLGGWLKKAGQRSVEDINNRGGALSIKNVANENQDYTDDIRNMQINDGTRLPSSLSETNLNAKTPSGMVQELRNSYTDAELADLIARETDPVQRALLTEASNSFGTRPRYSADELYDIADQSAVDLQNKLAGNAGGNPPRNPATELYNNLNRLPEEPIDLTDAFGDKGLGTIQKKNKLQSLGQQVQNSAKVQKYAPVYDSLDARTAKRAAETNAPQQLADLGVRPQDYNEYAKTSSYVNRVMSDLAERSGVKVNAPDLPSKLSADNIDVVMSDSALKKYNGYIKQIVPDGDSPAQYSASYLLEKSRELGNKAANLRGNTDDVGALRQALTDAKWTLRDIATNALEGSMVTGDATNDMIANGLKDLGANQKVQDYYTEAVDGKAPSVADYIRRSSLFEQARDMGTQIEAEKYTRSASKQPTRFATKLLRASGIEQPLETVLRNTVAPVASGVTNLAGKAIEGAGNAYARISGNGSVDSTGNTGNIGVVTPEVMTNPDYNPQTRLYNVIGRTEGLSNAEQARTASYLADAAQEAEVVPNTNVAGTGATMDSMQSIMPATNANTASTALYNTINGTQQTSMPTYSSTEEERAVYFFPPTGDYWSDMLSRAMRRAKNAEDYDAMASLYEMYQDATTKLAKQSQSNSESSTASKKLTATQQRANAAMNSLERISTMEPDLGYNLSQIPVVGNIATLGGNNYEAEAKSLAQQIGYMVSGANIKEEEAYNIGKAYVPQPFDSEQTRKNKLQRAYDIIQQYQNGYAE